MTILTSPLWPELEPHFTIVHASKGDSAKSRIRIELSPLPQALYLRAMELTQPCAECGRLIHPIRSRRAPSKRGKPVAGAYYAAACPLSVNVGCSRGAAASNEYLRVRAWFEADQRGADPGASFEPTNQPNPSCGGSLMVPIQQDPPDQQIGGAP